MWKTSSGIFQRCARHTNGLTVYNSRQLSVTSLFGTRWPDQLKSDEEMEHSDYCEEIKEMLEIHGPSLPSLPPARPRFMNPTDPHFFMDSTLSPDDVMDQILFEYDQIGKGVFLRWRYYAWIHDLVDYFHDFMPYWMSVMMIPIMIKLMLAMPVAILVQKSRAKYLSTLPESTYELFDAVLPEQENYHRVVKSVQLQRKYKYNPTVEQVKNFIHPYIFWQLHGFTCYGMGRMTASYPDFLYGGWGPWIDLTVKDSTWILDTMSVSMLVCSMFIDRKIMNRGNPTSMERLPAYMALWFMICLPIIHVTPIWVNAYVSGHAISQLLYIAFINNDRFRAIFNLPPAEWMISQSIKVMDSRNRAMDPSAYSINHGFVKEEIFDHTKAKRKRRTPKKESEYRYDDYETRFEDHQ